MPVRTPVSTGVKILVQENPMATSREFVQAFPALGTAFLEMDYRLGDGRDLFSDTLITGKAYASGA